jgi:multidrug efflux pump subunit AcrA (membrane-fusion protein)
MRACQLSACELRTINVQGASFAGDHEPCLPLPPSTKAKVADARAEARRAKKALKNRAKDAEGAAKAARARERRIAIQLEQGELVARNAEEAEESQGGAAQRLSKYVPGKMCSSVAQRTDMQLEFTQLNIGRSCT